MEESRHTTTHLDLHGGWCFLDLRGKDNTVVSGSKREGRENYLERETVI